MNCCSLRVSCSLVLVNSSSALRFFSTSSDRLYLFESITRTSKCAGQHQCTTFASQTLHQSDNCPQKTNRAANNGTTTIYKHITISTWFWIPRCLMGFNVLSAAQRQIKLNTDISQSMSKTLFKSQTTVKSMSETLCLKLHSSPSPKLCSSLKLQSSPCPKLCSSLKLQSSPCPKLCSCLKLHSSPCPKLCSCLKLH